MKKELFIAERVRDCFTFRPIGSRGMSAAFEKSVIDETKPRVETSMVQAYGRIFFPLPRMIPWWLF